MGNRVITISREFGSGGGTIGRAVAEKLGIPYYNQDIIEKMAAESGYSKEYVEELTEDVQTGLFGMVKNRDFYGHSIQDELFELQTKVIQEVVEQTPCVIIGRCADYILRDHDNLLSVYIHASLEFRAERIVSQYGERPQNPLQRLQEKDKKRKAYYQLYTDRKWGAVENYHLALDSGVLGIERCAELITNLY